MSWTFNTIIITDNYIDEERIHQLFNKELSALASGPIYAWDDPRMLENPNLGPIYPQADEPVLPCLRYHGLLSLEAEPNNKAIEKYCYFIENGNRMFFRRKYALIDTQRNMLLSRAGYELFWGGPDSPMLSECEAKARLAEEVALDEPPTMALRSLFDYILAENQYFYMMFEDIYVENVIKNYRDFIEKRLHGKRIRAYQSQDIRDQLLMQFNTVTTADTPAIHRSAIGAEYREIIFHIKH